jgi:hypothetical protein
MYIMIFALCCVNEKTNSKVPSPNVEEAKPTDSPPPTVVESAVDELPAPTKPSPKRVPPKSPSVSVQTHCTPEEQVVFSCATDSKSSDGVKTVSVCGDLQGKESDWIQYRFGVLGKIELNYPKEKGEGVNYPKEKGEGGNGFYFWEESSARSQGYILEFQNDDIIYQLISKMGGSAPKEAEYNNFIGINVRLPNKVMSKIHCNEYEYDADNLSDLEYWFSEEN